MCNSSRGFTQLLVSGERMHTYPCFHNSLRVALSCRNCSASGVTPGSTSSAVQHTNKVQV